MPWFYILWIYGFVCFAIGAIVAIFDLHGAIGTIAVTICTVIVYVLGKRRKP
jgi:hypothetical protein